MPSSDSKPNTSFDTASISTDSIMSEKERAHAQKEKKPSLAKRVVQGKKPSHVDVIDYFAFSTSSLNDVCLYMNLPASFRAITVRMLIHLLPSSNQEHRTS
jgi:hypothetical protein